MPQRKKGDLPGKPAVHLIDTNVILRFLMGDDPPKAARAAALMNRVERADELVELTDEVFTETLWTLESYYNVPRAELARSLTAVMTFLGVRLRWRQVYLQALQSYISSNADFVDCLLAARSKHSKVTVYTFDEPDFKKLDANWKAP